MKLLVTKLWFPYNVRTTLAGLFEIPQIQERFDEGFLYDGEMRPQDIKVCSGYWPANAVLDRLPESKKDVYLVLTSMDLKGDYGRIHGKGYNRKAIASNNSFLSGAKNNIFDPRDIDFQAMTFHELGHALGLSHHDNDSLNHCAMPLGSHSWSSLDKIRFCDECYNKIK